MSAKLLQRELFSYLSTDIDPYDFSAYIPQWSEAEGLDLPEETYAEDLYDMLPLFAQWLRREDVAGDWLANDPAGAPAYLTLRSQEMMPKGTWLVHFSKSDFNHFDRGTLLQGLHLSRWNKTKTMVDCARNLKGTLAETVFGFAYPADEMDFGTLHLAVQRYGHSIVLFRCDAAVLAFHDGDNERQAIFPLCSERKPVRLTFDYQVLRAVTARRDCARERHRVPHRERRHHVPRHQAAARTLTMSIDWRPAFTKWLEANLVRYHPGDIHYLNRGYWFPEPPPIGEEATNDTAWLFVQEDRENHAVFVNANVMNADGTFARDGVYAETAERAQSAVESILMRMG